MTAVLAMAPDAVTGWALVGGRGTVIALGASAAEAAGDVVDHLVRLAHRNGATVEAVLQRIPVIHTVGAEFAHRLAADRLDVFDITPRMVARQDWERSRAAREFAYPEEWDGRPVGVVERAALAIAAYYLKPGPQLRKLKAGAWTPWREPAPPRVARASLPR